MQFRRPSTVNRHVLVHVVVTDARTRAFLSLFGDTVKILPSVQELTKKMFSQSSPWMPYRVVAQDGKKCVPSLQQCDGDRNDGKKKNLTSKVKNERKKIACVSMCRFLDSHKKGSAKNKCTFRLQFFFLTELSMPTDNEEKTFMSFFLLTSRFFWYIKLSSWTRITNHHHSFRMIFLTQVDDSLFLPLLTLWKSTRLRIKINKKSLSITNTWRRIQSPNDAFD